MTSTALQKDNQFILPRPIRRTQPEASERGNFEAEVINAKRTPTPPPIRPGKKYLDVFAYSIPVRESKTITNIAVKVHKSHKPLTSRGLTNLMLASASSNLNEIKTEENIPKKGLLQSFSKLQFAMFGLAFMMILIGGYLSLVGLKYNAAAKNQAANLTNIANSVDGNKATAKGASSNPALSTKPITASELASYNVAPNMPRYITIPKLGVDARVLSVGVNSSGAIDTPSNIYDTAWYNQSALPGGPGASLIVGHVSSWSAHGVFYGIKSLVNGDIIKIQRGDGTIFSYKVVKTQIYSSGNVDMKAALSPVISSAPGLNLITCTGDVIPGTNNFSERIVVFATQVSS